MKLYNLEQNLIESDSFGRPAWYSQCIDIITFVNFRSIYLCRKVFNYISQAGKIDDNFINNIRAAVASNNIEGAKTFVVRQTTPSGEWLKRAAENRQTT